MKRNLMGAILLFAPSICFANSSALDIDNGHQITNGYYLLLENEGNGWKVDSIASTPPSVTDPSKQEILVFSNDLSMVEPYYSDYVHWYQNKNKPDSSANHLISEGVYSCFSGQKKKWPAYNPCISSLAVQTNAGISMAANAYATVLSLGKNLATVGAGEMMIVDKGKVQGVLENSDALKVVTAYQQKVAEQFDFDHATSSFALKNFIAKYQNNDPDGLVAQVEKKLPDVQAKEAAEAHVQYRNAYESASTASDFQNFINNYQNDDPDNLVPNAQLKLKSIIAKRNAEESQTREELVKWQNSLQVGDDTNCGEVLELRRGLVKVNFPVENYGNEHWIKKSLILKPGAGCKFVNGNYVY